MSYMLATLLAEGVVPQGAMLHRPRGQYDFYPFSNDGSVWTIDPEVWRACAVGAASIQAWFPLDIDDLIDVVCNRSVGSVLLGGIVDNALFQAIGYEKAIHLPSLEEWKSRIGVTNTRSLGFDVLDAMGLSALTNIGFLHSELTELSHDLVMNEFGLFPDAGCAAKFAKFSDSVAPEHAPFFGVEIVSAND